MPSPQKASSIVRIIVVLYFHYCACDRVILLILNAYQDAICDIDRTYKGQFKSAAGGDRYTAYLEAHRLREGTTSHTVTIVCT